LFQESGGGIVPEPDALLQGEGFELVEDRPVPGLGLRPRTGGYRAAGHVLLVETNPFGQGIGRKEQFLALVTDLYDRTSQWAEPWRTSTGRR
jgi:hypothetical protein